MVWLISFVTLVLIGIAGIAVVNSLMFPRLRAVPKLNNPMMVSVLIPARDEAAVIGSTVQKLLAQTYPDFEVIILDDHSEDGTADIAKAAAAGDSRLRVLPGSPLPAGWLGKNWACHQLAQAAQGECFIFTDADVAWMPGALTALVAHMEHTQADLLTVWPTQETKTWAERLIVPLMALVVIGYLPLFLVHHTPWPAFAAANGQCMVFRRRAYRAVGGHAVVRDQVLEDVLLARRLKAEGLRLRMVDGAGLVACRMYQGWASVRTGFAKNILAGYGGRVIFLVLATIFHWFVFLGPWVWLAVGWRLEVVRTVWPVGPLILIGLGVGVRALTAAVTRQRLLDALFLPFSVLLMTWIAGQSIWWQWRYGGPLWKGRRVKNRI